MSMSSLNQLHADRTARLQRSQRTLRFPALRLSLLTRKERRVATARVAPTC